ncbi:hypothetical protein [Calothrix sp. CCY 0018]|uniref:hypothetical protein n=1 Tax=Calothrix sp. CCY 0018 TaxID=3103864 RepID=UPI0039C5D95F
MFIRDIVPQKALDWKLDPYEYPLENNLVALLNVKSAVFEKEVVTINSQEGKRTSVSSPKSIVVSYKIN